MSTEFQQQVASESGAMVGGLPRAACCPPRSSDEGPLTLVTISTLSGGGMLNGAVHCLIVGVDPRRQLLTLTTNLVRSFSHLQHIQDTEEKANETVLVLNLNKNVISQLKRYYISIFESEELPEDIRRKCQDDLTHFERRIDGITSDMALQISRVEALLRSLADRKSLVNKFHHLSWIPVRRGKLHLTF